MCDLSSGINCGEYILPYISILLEVVCFWKICIVPTSMNNFRKKHQLGTSLAFAFVVSTLLIKPKIRDQTLIFQINFDSYGTLSFYTESLVERNIPSITWLALADCSRSIFVASYMSNTINLYFRVIYR